MSLEGKKIVFELSDKNFEADLDEDTPQDIFMDLLFDVQSGVVNLRSLFLKAF